MTTSELQTIPARHGKAAHMKAGQHIKVINTHGTQVLDNWALSDPDPTEFMSMEHSRFALDSVYAKNGDTMETNRRRPILTMVEDTSSGIHDTLVASCDIYLYQSLGVKEYHNNCADNFKNALKELEIEPPELPSPWNLFQHTPVDPKGSLSYPLPEERKGCYVVLRAEQDLVIVFSACPFDLPQYPVNGPDGKIADCHFEIY